ncbi:hypothetical protein BXZ70DRAFT_934190 [Cristinia sonorae]|uniref:Uncharacterized protein n=1 Tax=Cristinia sonorae TaxID=1940300 RepID=A0A8K0XRB7_9AGAR|nr:hypothetical protein BXZ70DRAFT_934190 [Cristinia sonorae]
MPGDTERGRSPDQKHTHSRQSSVWSIDLDIPKRTLLRRWSTKQWIAAFFALLFGTGLLSHMFLTRGYWPGAVEEETADMALPTGQTVVAHPVVLDKPRHHSAVLGSPTLQFRDNLRNDTRYMTSWLSAGFTNDVMTLGNLIYLARITNRVPVLPPLDSFIGKRPIAKPFSEIFDLPRLERALGMDVIEWKDVKDPKSEELDVLGCWNVFQVASMQATEPRFSRNAMFLKLDLSYTKAPPSVKLIPGFEHDSHSSFWSLAPLAFPDMRSKALQSMTVETAPSPWTSTSTLPDEQMLCFDYLFYICSDVPFEYDNDIYPSWQVVQKHFRWNAQVERVGQEYLRKLLNVAPGAPIPPHITIHARHGDFKDWCSSPDLQVCFASMHTFSRRVAEVQYELRQRRGISVRPEHVIVTSDEESEAWWDEVKAMGWLRIDHEKERTVERFGEWYPVIVDAYVQSAGLGFVGTDRSTFSTLARLRVRDWNDGAVRMVKWGKPDADEH